MDTNPNLGAQWDSAMGDVSTRPIVEQRPALDRYPVRAVRKGFIRQRLELQPDKASAVERLRSSRPMTECDATSYAALDAGKGMNN